MIHKCSNRLPFISSSSSSSIEVGSQVAAHLTASDDDDDSGPCWRRCGASPTVGKGAAPNGGCHTVARSACRDARGSVTSLTSGTPLVRTRTDE